MSDQKIRTGLQSGRFLKSLAVCDGDPFAAQEYAISSNWLGADVLKDALGAITTDDEGYSARQVQRDFVSLVYPQSILGKLPKVRKVPFALITLQQLSRAGTYWVREQGATPITLPTTQRLAGLRPYKLGAIIVASKESVRFDMSEEWISGDLAHALVAGVDSAFIDPANDGIPEEKPASITNNAISIPATTDPVADFKDAIAAYNGSLLSAAWVMHPDVAANLALRGEPFNKLTVLGGEIIGIPAITSEAVPNDSNGSIVTLLDQSAIQVSGDESARLRKSGEAMINMVTDPENDTPQLVSMFQTNSLGFQGQITTAWRNVRQAGSVIVIEGANYG
ncbi:hypothetical protein W822_15625 [Advenella kashmirensis W13003]|uniref:Phage capsid-like C-terminal domain-containing protein n=1 Tax=Advenella kashmirensis W13003 TaxID=1424334 RepID=V8QS11_9BURK|nr:phage major capsid protein [Advenella kashmirensis]ETF02427.1 hypothetical protein W822_15625 [Advenella kashmirensis W13003]